MGDPYKPAVDRIVVETERLWLRHFVVEDADFIARLLNTPGFLENIGDRGIRTQDDARRYLESGPLASYRVNGFGTYKVVLRASGVSLGMAGLTRKPWLQYPDMACAFLPEAEGKGYATEAARAVVAFAEKTLKLDHLLAVALPTNRKSIRVLEKLGFTAAGFVEDPRDGATLSAFSWARGDMSPC
jgi:[ribosomal protein S5]-alanine N-acetyltransferase